VQLRFLERWISLLRLAAIPFVVLAVTVARYPRTGPWERWAWITTGAFVVGSLCFFALARSRVGQRHPLAQSIAAQVFDTVIVVGFVMVFAFEYGLPVQQALYIDLAAACVRFGITGGLILAVVSAPVLTVFAHIRASRFGTPYSWKLVFFQTFVEVLIAMIVGWLVHRLAQEGEKAEARSEEAERLHVAERRTVEELRRLGRLRADFVSMVSHDVRTPLAAVIGSARTLEQRWRELSPEQRDRFLALIADETARLAALVAEVTDTSRIDQGTFSYTFGDVDVGALVDEAVAAAEVARSSANIESAVEVGMPHINGDPVRLRQVLTNLIDNAVKYSPEGSPVEVRAEAVNGHVRVDVVDHGSGIAPRDQRLIFERFGRVPGTSKPGTGLGLYIARAIAEAHGGDLRVSSKLGEGSTFTLELPSPKKR
jgi:signal transduction histidine kinase